MKYHNSLIVICLLLAACTTEQEPVDTLTKRPAPQENTPPAQSAQPAQVNQEQPAPQKANIIQAYIKAGSAKGRSRYVVNPKTALPRMEKRYRQSNLKGMTLEEVERIDGEGDPRPGKYGKYRASWTDHRDRRDSAIYYIKNTRDGLKIDWETSIGYNEMSLKLFKTIRPAGPKVFRCEAELSGHYDPFKPNMAREYYSVHLSDPGGLAQMWGYVRKNSELGKRLFDILKDGETHKITLKMSLIDPDDPYSWMAIISNLVSEDWLIR
ncbi:MAG: hypothetical protein OXL96_00955 [Candidatus Poribacteria bacterium]|nr:hypothetical protein [Candidatus Poribacteria bacterium]